MLEFIDSILNRVTMYRLVLYYLIVLIVAAMVFGFVGLLPYAPLNILFSAVIITLVCWVVNTIFAKTFSAATNVESVYITALILALIISPVAPNDVASVGFLAFASAFAMASKYILAIGKRHIFNPAAFGVAAAGLIAGTGASWWVAGNFALLPLVFVGGLFIVRKLRRFDLVLSFMIVALLSV